MTEQQNRIMDRMAEAMNRLPYHAVASTSVRALDVVGVGVHASVPVSRGFRQWGFTTRDHRDTFCKNYGGIAVPDRGT